MHNTAFVPYQSISCLPRRELRLCKEGGGFGADGLSVLLANMSRWTACVYAQISIGRSDPFLDESISSFLPVVGLVHPFWSEFAEKITAGVPKGLVRCLSRKDLSKEFSSVVEDGWLNISATIVLVSYEGFRNLLSPILRQPQTHRLPKIDSCTEVQYQGTDRFLKTTITLDRSTAGGVGWNDMIDHCYRLTTNKWFARYEVRNLRCLSHCDGGLCSNSCLCINSFCIRLDRSSQMLSRWKVDYGAKKTPSPFFR